MSNNGSEEQRLQLMHALRKKKQARRLVCTNSPNDVLDDVHEIFKWVINQLSVA